MRVVRRVPAVVSAAALAVCVLSGSPASAQEFIAPAFQITEDTVDVIPFAFSIAAVRRGVEPARSQPLLPVRAADVPRRPGALIPLYGSLIALQSLDVHSTRSALDNGNSREANPAMRPVVKHSAAFVAVKAGATAGVIWASEKMWKKNRKGSLIFAGLVNAAMAAVVANNYRVSR